MKWLTLDYIKEHSRLDYSGMEDAVLELYGTSAETAVLNLCRRTYEDVIDTYGEVPAPMRHASLLLVDHFYQQRSPAGQSLSAIPYTFDMLLKPYMRLAD